MYYSYYALECLCIIKQTFKQSGIYLNIAPAAFLFCFYLNEKNNY